MDDAECRERAAAIAHLATDLSSAPEDQGDFLRLRILRDIESLQDRLGAIAAARAGADSGSAGKRTPKHA